MATNSALDSAFTQFRTNLSNTGSDVGKVITKTAAPVSNFIKQATSLFAPIQSTNTPSLNYKVNNLQQKQPSIVSTFVKKAQQGMQDWAQKNPARAQNIINAPAKIIQTATEPIASIPFNAARNKINQQSKGLFVYPGSLFPEKPFVPQSRNFPEQFQTPAPNMSYVPEDQMLIKDQSDPQLEAIKQNLLRGSNIRPSARQYLSDVPIRYGQTTMDNAVGVAREANTPWREIVMNPDLVKPQIVQYLDGTSRSETPQETKVRVDNTLSTVIQHELLHQTPELVPTSLFTPKNKKAIDYYVNRWGKEYMNNDRGQVDTKRLVGEMFAEQDLPAAYYWHIYKRVVPSATPSNFIDAIKSYFVNSVNTPQNSVIPSNTGTVVPNSGGQPVLNQ